MRAWSRLKLRESIGRSHRASRILLPGSVALAVLEGTLSSALADPITATNVFDTIYSESTNDLGLFAGTGIYFGAKNVAPNGSHDVTSSTPPDSTGTATTTYTGSGISIPNQSGGGFTTISNGQTVSWVLGFHGNTAFPNEISTGTFLSSEALPNGFGVGIAPYDPGLLNPWTLTLRNGTNSTTVTTPSLSGAAPVAFASNVTFTPGTNPTFTWTNPAGATGQTVIIIDKNIINPTTGFPDQVFSSGLLPAGTTSFTIPTALGGGLTLDPTHQYAIQINESVRRSPLGCTPGPDCTTANVQAISDTIDDFFVRSSDGPPVVYAPKVDNLGVFHFDMTVIAGQTFFIDPLVATGYDYKTGASDPNFACVTLPNLQSSPYDVSFMEGGSTISDLIFGNAKFCFPTGGVSEFDVTDINPELGLDPSDPTAFITGLDFVGPGQFTGTMTPLAASIPEPGALAIFVSSLAGFALLRRRRAVSAV
jgi:hypothetical protein